MGGEKDKKKILFICSDKSEVESIEFNLGSKFEVTNSLLKKFSLFEIEKIKPDLILLPFNLDRAEDYNISNAIRTSCGLQNIPLIYLCDKKKSEDINLVIQKGGDDFLLMPIDFEELSARIDYQIKAGRKRNNLIDQISERDKLFSIISHDLRKPFASLMGITHLLSESAQFCTFDELRDLAKENYKTVTNTYHLLENLLEWCKVKSGQTEFKPAEIDISHLISRVTAHLEDLAVKKNIKVKFNIAPGCMVFADERMIYTVLKNLIENALKFSETGSMVKITKAELSDKVLISIEDNGVGIKKDELNKLFNISSPYSTNGTQGERGSGLGLILAKELIRKNHGELSLVSKFGAGSKFSILLPAKFN